MDENHFMMISLEDSKSKAISEVLGSKTCKKIISYLSERKEASQQDLSNALNIPMNTLDYNIKKLLESGFIQKRKNFFWSKKGKKIIMYELSNKSIIISPKRSSSQKIKSIIPASILTAVSTFAVWTYEKIKYASEYSRQNILTPSMDFSEEILSKGTEEASGSISATIDNSVNIMTQHPTQIWTWFLAGALIVLFIFSIVNWKKL
jgi:DeoR/GlpR family transcriptional regulator of sugar metabolism